MADCLPFRPFYLQFFARRRIAFVSLITIFRLVLRVIYKSMDISTVHEKITNPILYRLMIQLSPTPYLKHKRLEEVDPGRDSSCLCHRRGSDRILSLLMSSPRGYRCLELGSCKPCVFFDASTQVERGSNISFVAPCCSLKQGTCFVMLLNKSSFPTSYLTLLLFSPQDPTPGSLASCPETFPDLPPLPFPVLPFSNAPSSNSDRYLDKEDEQQGRHNRYNAC